MQPTKDQAKQAIFDNLPFVVESQTYSQRRFDAIKAKCQAVNLVHAKLTELQPIVKEYVKTFLGLKVCNKTGGYNKTFEKGLPVLPSRENGLNAYYQKSYSSIYIKVSQTVGYKTLGWRDEEKDETMSFESHLYLGTFDTETGTLKEIHLKDHVYPQFNFEEVKQHLIKLDQLKRFLSSQESVLGCSNHFQNML